MLIGVGEVPGPESSKYHQSLNLTFLGNARCLTNSPSFFPFLLLIELKLVRLERYPPSRFNRSVCEDGVDFPPMSVFSRLDDTKVFYGGKVLILLICIGCSVGHKRVLASF